MLVTNATINYNRAYFVITLAVLTEAMVFILRAGSSAQIQNLFFTKHYLASAAEMTAIVLAAPFLGFSLALLFVSPFIDWLGMKRVVITAALLFIAGILLTVFSDPDQEIAFSMLRVGAFLTGLAWGSVESVLNPLVTTLYPHDKARYLARAHAWWPAGLIVGGVLGLLCDNFGLSFHAKTSIALIPAVLFGLLCVTVRFPVTERVSLGVSNKEMFLELFRRPSFFIWLLVMLLGSLTELGASSFVDLALTPVTSLFGLKGIWILLYVSSVMFLMRRNAGLLTKRFSTVGVLWVSMLLATLGLFGLSISDNIVTTMLSATLWGMGASLLWPTMMANVSFRYPRGGSLFLGLLGISSCATVWLLLPHVGALYDSARITAAGSVEVLQSISAGSPAMQEISAAAAAAVFQALAMLTTSVMVILSVVWLVEKYRKPTLTIAPENK